MEIKIKFFSTASILFVVLALSLYSCADSEDSEDLGQGDINHVNEDIIEMDQSLNTTLDGKLFSIPSPIQMMDIIKNSGISYEYSILNKPENAVNYLTVPKKALNLGIYGANLGYVTVFEMNDDALSFLKAVEKLSDDLGIAGAFDAELIDRISNNSSNKDSMLVLVTEAYRKGDNFLKENERTEISTLILVGGWVEALYFAAKLAKENDTDELLQRIAEQKTSLNSLIELLKKNEEGGLIVNFLIESFEDLKLTYEKIEESYEFVQPFTNAEEKLTVIQSKSSVSINNEVLTEILDKITSIRNEIIS